MPALDVTALASAFAVACGGVAVLLGALVRTRRALREARAEPVGPARAVTGSYPTITPAGSPPRPRILYIDDEESFGVLIRRILQRRDLDVDVATSAAAARALVDRHSYRVIIADMRLPGGTDGLTLIERLRPRTVLYSGAFVGDGRDAADVGAEGRVDLVLSKNVELEELGAAVERLARGG